MSQGKVDFLKKSSIQMGKTFTATDAQSVEGISNVILTLVEDGDIIIDTEMPTSMGEVTLDWSTLYRENDYVVSITKGSESRTVELAIDSDFVINDFTIRIETTSTPQIITLPFESGFAIDCNIDWGDDSNDDINTWNDSNLAHSYANPGTYDIHIVGEYECFSFSGLTELTELIELKQGYGFKKYNFSGCTNLTTIDSSFKNIHFNQINSLSSAFNGTSSLTTIPANLFESVIDITSVSYMFYNSGITEISGDFFNEFTSTTDFSHIFRGCDSLTSIPDNLFEENIDIEDLSYSFFNSGITEIPEGLLDNNINIINVKHMFQDCADLITIPVDLFKYNIDLDPIENTFSGCSSIVSLPSTIFSTVSSKDIYLSGTFKDCTSLTSIPSDFLNSKMVSFSETFSGCSSLASIPDGLFDDCINASNFEYTFLLCNNASLTTIPDNLLSNTDVTNISYMFYGCTGLTCSVCGTGEFVEDVLAVNGSVTSSSCFQGCTNISDYDTGTPNLTDDYPDWI